MIKYTQENMPCSICRQTGHNRSTCSQRTNITSLSNNPPSPPPVPPPQNNPVINDTGTRRITLINMRDENYLVYWVYYKHHLKYYMRIFVQYYPIF